MVALIAENAKTGSYTPEFDERYRTCLLYTSHLAIIFGNLLENALEACRKLPQEQRYIMLEATYIKEMLQILSLIHI